MAAAGGSGSATAYQKVQTEKRKQSTGGVCDGGRRRWWRFFPMAYERGQTKKEKR